MPVCIAGMHRSGTSMVARLLAESGLYLGAIEDLAPPADDSSEGSYEHDSFVSLNTRILRRFHGDWDFPPSFPNDWADSPMLASERSKARRLAADLGVRETWGWKDPRSTLTMPFWLQTLPDLKVVVCVRNPLEVAVSLQRRHALSYEMSLNLWLAYNQRLLDTLDGREFLVTHYAAYFANPRAELERLNAFAGLTPSEDDLAAAETAISAGLRHSAFTVEHLLDLGGSPELAHLYARLCRLAGWHEDGLPDPSEQDSSDGAAALNPEQRGLRLAVIDAALQQHEIERWSAAYHRQHESIERLQSELEDRDRTVRERENSAAWLREEIAAAESKIETLESQVRERDRQVADAESLLAERDRTVAELADERDELQAATATTAQQIDDLERDLAERTRRTGEQAEQIDQLETRLAERYHAIGQLQAQATQRSMELDDLTGQIDRLQGQIDERSAEVARLEAELVRHQELAVRQEDQLTRYRVQAARQEDQLARQQEQVARHEATIEQQQEQLAQQAATIAQQQEQIARQLEEAARQQEVLLREQEKVAQQQAQLLEAANSPRSEVNEAQVRLLEARLQRRERQVEHWRGQANTRAESVAWLSSELEVANRQLADRDAGIAWLRSELSSTQEQMREMAGSRVWRIATRYWRTRKRILRYLPNTPGSPPRLAGPPAEAFLAPGPDPEVAAQVLLATEGLASTAPTDAVERTRQAIDPDLGMKRPMSEEVAEAVLASSSHVAKTVYDVISFSPIDWEFRFQRPQQLMVQFARQGHRVFWIKPSAFLPADDTELFRARPLTQNIIEIQLAADLAPSIYDGVVDDEDEVLMRALAAVRRAFGIEAAVSYVQLPSWGAVGLRTRALWGWSVVYDCLDEWEGFPGINRSIAEYEHQLVRQADLVIVIGERLRVKWQDEARRLVLARNAVDFERYVERCLPNGLLKLPHPIVGYFGAIADWFDLELLEFVARRRPNWQFVLLGGVFDVDISAFQDLPNVHFLGQQPYELMPAYLFHFDVCTIPFKINEITNATDPVKLYEYLSAGKPVVATMMKELTDYADDVYLAANREEFIRKIEQALAEDDVTLVDRRIELARKHTWYERWTRIDAGIKAAEPHVSIIIVTYNGVEHTKLCLASLLANTDHPSYEVIIVDNASSDGTMPYLQYLAREYPNIRVIRNTQNYGFAKANNQGIQEATGEVIVLLNNDTVVPRGWLTRLCRRLENQEIGLLGPVTNFVGNEALVKVPYETYAEFERWVLEYTEAFDGKSFDIPMLAMYCLAMRRDAYEKIGPLDEQFGIGMFEDDDYAMRARQAGYRVVCAEDVYVHHFGQASFSKLVKDGRYEQLFQENRHRYEEKWNVTWKAHRPRPGVTLEL